MLNEQSAPSFDGLQAISAHLEQRNQLENFITGKFKHPPAEELLTCNAECMFAKWLYNWGCKNDSDRQLCVQICETCELFLSAASQALMLANMGKQDMANEALADGSIYSDASARLQRRLTRLHYQLNIGN